MRISDWSSDVCSSDLGLDLVDYNNKTGCEDVFVWYIAETAQEIKQYREKKEDERAIRGSLTQKRATNRIAKRATNAAIAEHDAAVTSAQELAKQVLIAKKAAEEESAMIWSMTQDEREAYLAAKKEQTERVKAEKLRMIREADEAQARFDLILNVIIGILVYFF